MPPPRATTPLAGWSVVATFVLIGVALLATVWSTRSSVLNASDAVRRGQALAIEQAVRADIADLDAAPSSENLAAILADHADEGLRYIGMVEGRGNIVASAGQAIGDEVDESTSPNRAMQEIDGRIRLTVRAFRRMKAGGRTPRFVVEIEPVQANELRGTAAWTLGIGALAAASLLGVAIVLVRREARRNADERTRERERRLAHLGEMSAVLAHEIKNPLASLKGNAQLLSQMLAKILPEGDKPRTKAERVVDEAVRLEQLTNDLLHFVRTGAIRREPVDPGAIVREAASSIPGEISVDTTRAPATWPLDAGRIREVVVNLVDNAVAAGAPVVATVRTEGERLVIEVSDHGPGVPVEDRERIFEPFHTGKTQGTGLGLAVARRVVESHGGTLSVLSAPSGGALFRAEIPES
ncbi:MAG: HAMP domain-containing histidine kinase [Myxococcales bacterium]|nr:HAMP domain-containing histidine kinase [Myxococcales bacterium]